MSRERGPGLAQGWELSLCGQAGGGAGSRTSGVRGRWVRGGRVQGRGARGDSAGQLTTKGSGVLERGSGIGPAFWTQVCREL